MFTRYHTKHLNAMDPLEVPTDKWIRVVPYRTPGAKRWAKRHPNRPVIMVKGGGPMHDVSYEVFGRVYRRPDDAPSDTE